MREQYINIIEDAINNPLKKIYELEILSNWEKNKLLYEFNNTDVDYPRNKTIHQLFEEQVEKTPSNIAVVFEEQSITYGELNNKRNVLPILVEKHRLLFVDMFYKHCYYEFTLFW